MVHGADEELWKLEAMNYHKNKLKVWSCFTVGSKLNNSVEKDVLLKSIHKLYCHRMKLRLNIFPNSKGKLITREINCWRDDFVEFYQFDESVFELSDFINNQHRQIFPFGVQNPLWKLIVINQRWLLFVVDHTLYDGTTVTLMNEELLYILNDQEITPEVNPDIKQFNALIRPGCLHLLSKVLETFSPDWIQPFVRYLVKPKTKYEGSKKGWVLNNGKTLTHQTYKYIISLDSKQFLKLKSILKTRNVQFTSFWVYLNILALSQLKNENIDISVPFNLRSLLLDEFQSYYGLLISHMQMNCKTQSNLKTIDWRYVKYINSLFTKPKLIKSAGIIGMLKYVCSKDLVLSCIPQPRKGVLEVSNLGLRIPKVTAVNPKFLIEEFIFSQPNDITGYYISNSIISTKNKTNITLDGVPEFGPYFKDFVQILESLLHNALDGLYD
ncbi:hypothetical protein BN7_6321 [Wickerhamomyces ciferrii]|uniref:N-acetyltransferase SLI1 n=1 Tax=Wickerhamomyces ciferrii (strain ATCC 14091 / BCRC 22168 / CBS 111 / JCM 3599 / NBRC 0793 / NRRL Y-1031 F-60-10) TaxID=1206466 RepID=K0KZF8_WICCF|nr:uncharacterized protein BN7_6321 [Wickerhamomyces ciferrii]CCH46724.1 hypothetical protein BN7_6321 [Wickerhamomyces ciferrii]